MTCGAARLQAAPAELTRVRFLLALDTGSNLKDQLTIDEARLVRLLRSSIPAGRLELTVLKGAQLTRANVLAYYQKLRTGPREAIVFFYGGHGILHPRHGHFLCLQEGKEMLRRESLRRLMLSKRAGLTVLLTDCCSAYPRSGAGPLERTAREEPRAPATVVQHLFLRSRGLVDITAASPGGSSWGDARRGGFFTFALCGVMARQPRELDANRDGRVSWKELFPFVQRFTDGIFQTWLREVRGKPGSDKVEDRNQRPQAFALEGPANPGPTPPEGPSTVPPGEKPARALVALGNASRTPVSLHYRWNVGGEWRSGVLQPGQRVLLAQPVSAVTARRAFLTVVIPKTRQVHRLAPRIFTGSRPPTLREARLYLLRRPATRIATRSFDGGEPELVRTEE
jgi:hypothetical protein